DRHATPLGRGDHRLALAQRPAEVEPALLLPQPGQRRAGQRVAAPAASPPPHAPAEVEPALLLPQPGQRRAGQRVEAPAASLAPEPPQSVGLAAADRRPVAAVRAAPFVTRARLDPRPYRRTQRASR